MEFIINMLLTFSNLWCGSDVTIRDTSISIFIQAIRNAKVINNGHLDLVNYFNQIVQFVSDQNTLLPYYNLATLSDMHIILIVIGYYFITILLLVLLFVLFKWVFKLIFKLFRLN